MTSANTGHIIYYLLSLREEIREAESEREKISERKAENDLILKEGESLTVEELKVYITEHLARHKVPRYIEFVSEFPMNAAGKILKYKMREEAAKRLGL